MNSINGINNLSMNLPAVGLGKTDSATDATEFKNFLLDSIR